MSYNKVVHLNPRHQQGQRSVHSGQAVFTLAKELQLCAESVSLGSDIISQYVLVNLSKLLLNCPVLFCMLICLDLYYLRQIIKQFWYEEMITHRLLSENCFPHFRDATVQINIYCDIVNRLYVAPPFLSKHTGKLIQCPLKMQKVLSGATVLVCHGDCSNMAVQHNDSVEETDLCQGKKNTTPLILRGLYTNENVIIIIIFHSSQQVPLNLGPFS